MRHLQRDGRLTWGQVSGLRWTRDGETLAEVLIRGNADGLTLTWRHRNGEWQRLDWTACTYGGQRAWFLFPAAGCGRRVVLLYLGGVGVFACRHCYGLAYASQRETVLYRALRRADNIRDRLGWPPGIATPPGGKPKGMHQRAFERLKARHDAYVAVSLAGITQWLELMNLPLAGPQDDLDGDG